MGCGDLDGGEAWTFTCPPGHRIVGYGGWVKVDVYMDTNWETDGDTLSDVEAEEDGTGPATPPFEDAEEGADTPQEGSSGYAGEDDDAGNDADAHSNDNAEQVEGNSESYYCVSCIRFASADFLGASPC
jgi:hypothetical protein